MLANHAAPTKFGFRAPSVYLFTAVRRHIHQETLSPLREPTSAARPAVSSRIALLEADSQIRIRRTLLWFSFPALVGKAETSTNVLGEFVRRCFRFQDDRFNSGLRHAVARRL